MQHSETLLQVIEASDRRRDERRKFIQYAGGGALALGATSLLSACGGGNNSGAVTPAPSPTPTPSPTSTAPIGDADILNFALNLEYLEAQFYSYAAFGTGLPATMLGGTGRQGAATGGQKVTFTDPVVEQYAREIARDEIAHVAFLRSALGTAAVAQPGIDISGAADGPFTAAARAAGVVGATGVFNPYASDENFLLGAFIFEDVGVTAYKGASPLLTSKVYLEAAAGILAAEAYHAGLVRTVLYAKGMNTAMLRTAAGQISNARDSLDGPSDDDQGIVNAGDATQSNIVPTDSDGLAFSRTPGAVLNIVYLTKAATVGGGFFPGGVNGRIATSTAQP
ncbi:ferritin-like domain-containing protein [Sphingomonas sp. So64.6b]|uniref:ferritin-like domain-containing protein n=1 Tax=Sphingomonas sp. So64.6b TaxID=2997354 RepID=UPI001600661A|nr:ferritin-like domain-containing protein [Sphingomonas sp. So64.6b]QNA85930.1 ferritin-like domain-containing protein [Sphingomonas sp. So64.6b]